MAKMLKDEGGKRSLRVELSAADDAVLEEAVRLFGVGKSELVRRLVRASVEAGPALSDTNMIRLEELSGQVRVVGRNLMQVVRAIHRGDAVGIAESEPVWRGLQELIAAIDDELAGIMQGSGRALRAEAGLGVLEMSASGGEAT
jgi:hypothetical protein